MPGMLGRRGARLAAGRAPRGGMRPHSARVLHGVRDAIATYMTAVTYAPAPQAPWAGERAARSGPALRMRRSGYPGGQRPPTCTSGTCPQLSSVPSGAYMY